MTDGFYRLWEEQRLYLTVENVAWRNREIIQRKAGQAAAERLAACGFDVRNQQHVQRVP
jgi:hypothetical protein